MLGLLSLLWLTTNMPFSSRGLLLLSEALIRSTFFCPNKHNYLGFFFFFFLWDIPSSVVSFRKMDSSLVLSLKLNPCFNSLNTCTPCLYPPPLRLSPCYYSRRFCSPVTVNAAKKTSQIIRSELDDRINGSDSRFLDRVNFFPSPFFSIQCEHVSPLNGYCWHCLLISKSGLACLVLFDQ